MRNSNDYRWTKRITKIYSKNKCESQVLELKRAEFECPKRLYDTLSSFSNQDTGGTILFGIYEENDYEEVGVYDPQDIQKKINEKRIKTLTVYARQEVHWMFIDHIYYVGGIYEKVNYLCHNGYYM